MKIYHYTKGLHLKSIFKDGFIATEKKRNLSPSIPFFTDLAWFTESKIYPVTALPYIPSIPSTNLTIRQLNKNMATDYASIASDIGGFWRFGFDSSDPRFKKWHYCNARIESSFPVEIMCMERIANNVGDNTRLFWISEADVPLKNFTLEGFSTITNSWVKCEPSDVVFEDLPSGGGYTISVITSHEVA